MCVCVQYERVTKNPGNSWVISRKTFWKVSEPDGGARRSVKSSVVFPFKGLPARVTLLKSLFTSANRLAGLKKGNTRLSAGRRWGIIIIIIIIIFSVTVEERFHYGHSQNRFNWPGSSSSSLLSTLKDLKLSHQTSPDSGLSLCEWKVALNPIITPVIGY